MRPGRKVIFTIAALLAVFAGGLFFLAGNLDSLVRRAIEKWGSEAAGTPVRVASVHISLEEAKGTIDSISVANPAGFSPGNIFELGGIQIKIAPATLADDLRVLDEILVTAPRFRLELNSLGKTNVGIVKHNLERFSREKTDLPPSSRSTHPRLAVRRLVIRQAVADLDLTALGGRILKIELGDIALANLGGPAGMTADQLAPALMQVLVKELEKGTARQELNRAIRDKFGPAGERLQKKIDEKFGSGAGATLQNLLGN